MDENRTNETTMKKFVYYILNCDKSTKIEDFTTVCQWLIKSKVIRLERLKAKSIIKTFYKMCCKQHRYYMNEWKQASFKKLTYKNGKRIKLEKT